MDLIADILLVAGALGAGVYCFVLARRLARFNDLESGVGGAVAVLSVQVDDLTRTLQSAQRTAAHSTLKLETLTARSESVAKRLELMLAAMHDLPAAADADTDSDTEQTDEAAALKPDADAAEEAQSEAKVKRRAKQKTKRKRKPGTKKQAESDPEAGPMFKRRGNQEQAA